MNNSKTAKSNLKSRLSEGGLSVAVIPDLLNNHGTDAYGFNAPSHLVRGGRGLRALFGKTVAVMRRDFQGNYFQVEILEGCDQNYHQPILHAIREYEQESGRRCHVNVR